MAPGNNGDGHDNGDGKHGKQNKLGPTKQVVPKPLPKSMPIITDDNIPTICSNDCRRHLPVASVIMCRHIVLKHNQSRNAVSHRTELRVTIPLEAAERIVELVRQKLVPVSGGMLDKHFAKYAEMHSDCPSHKVGGDLGPLSRGRMHKSFENAAFSLLKGQVSDTVITDSGIHLIYRYG